jgi:large subunit ribosomal protein L22
MEVAAKLRFARISAQKCRLVADQIRGLPVAQALKVLAFSRKKAARMVHKVSNVQVDGAPSFARYTARAKGRGDRILKRNSHITIRVGDE